MHLQIEFADKSHRVISPAIPIRRKDPKKRDVIDGLIADLGPVISVKVYYDTGRTEKIILVENLPHAERNTVQLSELQQKDVKALQKRQKKKNRNVFKHVPFKVISKIIT